MIPAPIRGIERVPPVVAVASPVYRATRPADVPRFDRLLAVDAETEQSSRGYSHSAHFTPPSRLRVKVYCLHVSLSFNSQTPAPTDRPTGDSLMPFQNHGAPMSMVWATARSTRGVPPLESSPIAAFTADCCISAFFWATRLRMMLLIAACSFITPPSRPAGRFREYMCSQYALPASIRTCSR